MSGEGASSLPAPLVVVATHKRPAETAVLMDYLAAQTLPPARIIVVGSAAADLEGLDAPREGRSAPELVVSPRLGLTSQRNVGLSMLREDGQIGGGADSFVAFFDDDFRPARDWLMQCAQVLRAEPSVAGLTGRVLADGVNGRGITEAEAQSFLAGAEPEQPHWTSRPADGPVNSLYGCNMAIRGEAAAACAFDEALPLYGWQEDTDFTGQVKAHGRTIVVRACRGVHLGVRDGRPSGLRLGYSQIANPIHIAGRGNMRPRRALRFVAHALASNLWHSASRSERFDYPGRLRGNLQAIGDLIRGACHPTRILEL